MVLIEEHDENGVNWGISFEGGNPTADKFLPLPSKEEAIRVFELIEKHGDTIERKHIQLNVSASELDKSALNWQNQKLKSGMLRSIPVDKPQVVDSGTDPNPIGDLVQRFLETAEDAESEESYSSDLVLQERARVYRFAASRITATLEEINGLPYGQGQVG